ncbi:MAG: 6-phosphogluconolactonase [Candidatus Limnocylindria bacterium]
MTADGRFTVLPNPDAVAAAAADRFVEAAREAIEKRGAFRVALSGGSTPKAVYPLLSGAPRRDRVDWSRVEFFWGDERTVPPDHPESNFGVAYQMLIAQLPNVRPNSVHRMPAEASDLDAAALAYEAELRLAFGARGDEPPAFDLVWLGMGPDGHTASLFPDSEGLDEGQRWAIGNWAPGPEAWRMTLTYPVLNAARAVIFVLSGADKAPALATIRDGSSDPPAARVRPASGSLEWIVDAAAAGEAA